MSYGLYDIYHLERVLYMAILNVVKQTQRNGDEMNATYEYSHPDTHGRVITDLVSSKFLFEMIAARLDYMGLIPAIKEELREQLYFLSHKTLMDMYLNWDQYDFASWYRSSL